jgi:hypothetical protein
MTQMRRRSKSEQPRPDSPESLCYPAPLTAVTRLTLALPIFAVLYFIGKANKSRSTI